jgi:prepilin-type N-terminal cleavage/methylation domain-containing protein
MNTLYKRNSRGFTIIEVVLVLAIAGLILLMVFIALPALQRGQRDTQRRNDMARVMSQITNYQTNARGAVPTNGNIADFQKNYLKTDFNDPQTGNAYKITAQSDPSKVTSGNIAYQAGYICNTTGTGFTKGTTKQAAVITVLEGSGLYCQDNR